METAHNYRAVSSQERRRKLPLRLFRRGTDLLPPGGRPKSCRQGTKQALLVDLLARPGGATMDELTQELEWKEATVRAGFGWDLKNKGYGVRSEFDVYGEEHFHLVVPPGSTVPEHHHKSKK